MPNLDDNNGNGVADFLDEIPKNPAESPEFTKIQIDARDAASISFRVASTQFDGDLWRELVRAFIINDDGTSARIPEKGALDLQAGQGKSDLSIYFEVGDFAGGGRPKMVTGAIGIHPSLTNNNSHREVIFEFPVAPFLVSCCLDPAESVHVVKTKITERFVTDLDKALAGTGARLEAFEDKDLPNHDIWMQDAVEIGYAAGPRGFVNFALAGNRGKKLDELFEKKYLTKKRATIRKARFRGDAMQWIDWYGNLEASPPARVDGKNYPFGRVYAGTQGERAQNPDIIKFIEEQCAQGPVAWVDTSWLVIGHVDEIVSWVPARAGTPYRMLVASPKLAVALLQKAEKDSPGGVIHRGIGGKDASSAERPVAGILNDAAFMQKQLDLQTKIDGIVKLLQKDLGVADGDVVPMPVLFNDSLKEYKNRFVAETPDIVNSLLVGSRLIVPDPHAPLVNGKDIFLEYMRSKLEPLGCDVRPIDDDVPYHRWLGEVHCGTNATRAPRTDIK
ncbi:MAG: hypothetical protein HY286_12010 [Planctomycetes bacterium]|nr:hypothetical protein [Planctomycetota bacterium]